MNVLILFNIYLFLFSDEDDEGFHDDSKRAAVEDYRLGARPKVISCLFSLSLFSK